MAEVPVLIQKLSSEVVLGQANWTTDALSFILN